MTTGPQDPAAAGGDLLRAGDADREQVIETLKTAFVHGQLTKDELSTRAGQALKARTCAALAALTADIPHGPPAARPARLPAPARRWPLARAAAQSGGCLVIAAAAVRVGTIADPGNTPGSLPKFLVPLCLLVLLAALVAALSFLAYGVGISVEQRRSRRQLPPPGPGGHALDGERRGGSGHDPVPPNPSTGQTRAEMHVHRSRQNRQRIPARPERAGDTSRDTSRTFRAGRVNVSRRLSVS